MTVSVITKTELRTVTKTEEVKVAAGVQYTSNSSDRAVRITPSSSMAGRFTITVSNPDGSNEKAVILKKEDMVKFLQDSLKYVRGY